MNRRRFFSSALGIGTGTALVLNPDAANGYHLTALGTIQRPAEATLTRAPGPPLDLENAFQTLADEVAIGLEVGILNAGPWTITPVSGIASSGDTVMVDGHALTLIHTAATLRLRDPSDLLDPESRSLLASLGSTSLGGLVIARLLGKHRLITAALPWPVPGFGVRCAMGRGARLRVRALLTFDPVSLSNLVHFDLLYSGALAQ